MLIGKDLKAGCNCVCRGTRTGRQIWSVTTTPISSVFLNRILQLLVTILRIIWT